MTTTTAVVEDEAAGPAPTGKPAKTSTRSWVLFTVIAVLLAGTTIGMFLPLQREVIGGLAVLMMIILIFIRVPIAMAMIVPALLGMYSLRGMPLVVSTMTTIPYQSVASWTMSVVPMFILMGLLLWRAGITDSMYFAASQWLSWMPGGLAVGTNLAGAGLASVSGSSVATTYALGRIGIPEMLKAGYDKRMAIGAVIVAGLPGQLIPPSIMLVIYAGIAEVPVGPQLMAGVGPGLLVAGLFTVMIVVMAKLHPEWTGKGKAGFDSEPAAVTWKLRWKSLASVWPVGLLVGVIIVGMFSGVFTATEAGAVSAALAVIVALWWKRGDHPIRAVTDASIGTISSVGAIFLMLVGVAALSRMLNLTGISQGFATVVEHLSLGRIEFLLLMVVIYLIMGAFMDPMAMMFLTVPILIPTLESLDISLLWFGAFAVFMGELAVVTPPVGILSYIIHGITSEPEVNQGQEISLADVFRAVGWFLPMAIVVCVILILFPSIATFIPDMMSSG